MKNEKLSTSCAHNSSKLIKVCLSPLQTFSKTAKKILTSKRRLTENSWLRFYLLGEESEWYDHASKTSQGKQLFDAEVSNLSLLNNCLQLDQIIVELLILTASVLFLCFCHGP